MSGKKDGDWINKDMIRLQNEFEKFLALKKKVRPQVEAFKIILIYMILGILWILLSDKIVHIFIKDNEIIKEIQLYKGWFYVFFTGGIFYKIVKRKLQLFEASIHSILEGYNELSITHEELIAMNEELEEQNNELEKRTNALIISEQRYELAVEGASDGIWDWDAKSNVYFFSLKWKSALGYHVDELGKTIETWRSLVHPDDRNRVNITLEQYLNLKDGIYKCSYRLRCKNGEYIWILSRGKGIWNKEGNMIRIAGSHTDITDQMNLEESLRIEKELSQSIIYEAQMVIVVFDKEENITQFNPYAEKVSGYKKEEVLGKNGTDFFLPHKHKESRRNMFQRILQGKNLSEKVADIQCKNGDYVTILWNNNLLHDKQKNIQGVVSIGIDITQRRALEDKLHMLAYYDTLTGLPNREYFEVEVVKQINKLEKLGKKAALIYLDIDDFKNINDTMGHSIGDLLIRYIGDVLSEQIVSPNIIARLGGDEFAILLVEVQEESYIVEQLEPLLEKLRKPWVFNNKSFYVSVSMGVAIYPEHGTNFISLTKNADTAMFHIKDNGKDAIGVFQSSMYEKTLSYIEMSNELRFAIVNQEFLLYYQPQFDLITGKIIGVEALIRWDHPKRGFIPPMEFIPFAEKTGHIVQIGEWVLRTACAQKRTWEEAGYPHIKMAVNLSSQMVSESGLVARIENILRDCKMDPCEIELEVTETAIMVELDKAREVLQNLKELGISIALDDFGTGYSSLTYLQTLPFDILKIDRHFLKNVVKEDEEIYIFRAIVDLAHNMGLKVVAEGVETKEQKSFLVNNNCDFAQGYYFCRPIPASELELIFKQESQ